ncbi:MAG: hypothetical protein ACRD3Q_12985, partial [Terriglobales bacterium]
IIGLGETRFGAIRTQSLVDAPVAAGKFPLVVLEPGLGFSAPQYTTIAENLASRGIWSRQSPPLIAPTSPSCTVARCTAPKPVILEI